MADTAAPAPIDAQEQLARIERMNAETRKFVEEGIKLAAEARKLDRDRVLVPISIAFTGLAAGAAIFGAAAAFLKLLGP